MKRWLGRIALVGGLLALAGFIVAASGVISITASTGHWSLTEWLLRFSMKRSIATHSIAVDVPENLDDPALVMKGAGHYDIGCRSCHGEPGAPQPRIAAHMLPTPPDLVSRIRESNPKRLFYAVKHGLKFTGMPAWPSAHRDDEVWAMVAFLVHYPQLDAAAYRRLTGRDEIAALGEMQPTAPRAPQAVALTCVRCHGPDGNARHNDAMPRLAGQRAEYLRKALEAYATGRRHSGIMEPIAAALSAEAMEELAGYYARLPISASRESSVAAAANADAITRGERIAREGIRTQRVPACSECHGSGARRGKPEFPLLAGQPAGYLELQLMLFRENHRGGSDHAHLMQLVASRLTPEQARDLAHYFASRSSSETAAAAGANQP